MTRRPIVMYLGGFAKVGGIEAFARDFLLSIANEYPDRELVIWGQRHPQNRLLADIAESGARISGSPWRWGCAWNIPDFVLAPLGMSAMRRAAAVIFKRPPPGPICRWLRQASRQKGRKIPFILVTPYRPAEYWGGAPDLSKLQDFDAITVQSEDGVADLRKAGFLGRIDNIPYLPPQAVELVGYPAARGDGVVRLGFLGRLAGQKNLGYLLDVFHVLTRKVDPAHAYELHLFGDGAERGELDRKCGELKLQGVIFHGEVPREEVSCAIDSCDLFLNTSLTEGQCLVALEVLARGRAMVATPVGALPDVLNQGDVGRLAPLGDAFAFASIVAEVAELIRARKITPQSVASVFRARYDYESVRRRYLDLLADLGVNPSSSTS